MTKQSRDSFAGFGVLIVDDNENNLFSLRTVIEKYTALTVYQADSGQAAIDLAVSTTGIDIIILDVQMPDLDGFQTAAMLKLRKNTRDIPVIFLTAIHKTDEFRRQGYEVGAVDYLWKPIEDDLLVNKLTSYCRLIRKEREWNRQLEHQVEERTRELRRQQEYQQRILMTMGEALLVLNPQGEITCVNHAAGRMLGYDEQALLGMNLSDVFEEADNEQADAFMGTWLEAVIRTGVIRDVEARFIQQDGTRLPILFSRTALTDDDGKVTDIICIAKNMSGYSREAAAASSEQVSTS